MNISTLVISDIDHFVGIKDFWDQELKDHADSPFLFSCMLIEHWKNCQKLGWHPFIIIFKSDAKIIGFAPLMMRSTLLFRHVTTFNYFTCPDFFSDRYREICIDKMISFLFKHLNCESANITFENESINQRLLENVCINRDFDFEKVPQEGQAIIPVNKNLDSFKESLGRKDCKKFQRTSRNLDRLGSWQISRFNIDHNSLAKIRTVEKFSWKASLEGDMKAKKDMGLESILKGIQRNCEGDSLFESEVWILELNAVPLAYVLVMKVNKTVVFAKTSYDSRFKKLSPGMFLINDLIERVFRNMAAEKIDFISNMPFVQVWKPLVKTRVMFTILRNPVLSKARVLVSENPIGLKTSQILLASKWRKKELY